MAKVATKVVVRLLPPLITEDELVATINEANLQQAVWTKFLPGKRYKGEAKASRNALCYFQFSSGEQAEAFIKDYHGHQFVDDRGEPFRAVAVYAPYQKAPKQKSQKDQREGTIQDDPTYQEFVASLSAPKAQYVGPQDPKHELRPTDPSDTPLLQHLKSKAKERRTRAEKAKEKRKWRSDGLELIEEEPKRPKWRCAECSTSKNLEEDPDARGTFYCVRCWESWESHQAPPPRPKKGKKAAKEAAAREAAAAADEESRESRHGSGKKKRDKEREASSYYSTEWREKDNRHADDEEADADAKRHKKKKKDKREAYEAKGETKCWRAKKKESGWEEGGGSDPEAAAAADTGRWSRAKQRRSEKEWDNWRAEEEQPPSQKKEKRPVKAAAAEDATVGTSGDSSGVGRWRAKAPTPAAAEEQAPAAAAAEEKPRRGRKEKKTHKDDEAKWVPKGG